ncbi:hypothetical protein [Arcanobacterium hippocoleae]
MAKSLDDAGTPQIVEDLIYFFLKVVVSLHLPAVPWSLYRIA